MSAFESSRDSVRVDDMSTYIRKGRARGITISSKLPMAEAVELGKQKILSRVTKTESGCWIWQGHLMSEGYAEMYFRGKLWRAHRLSYIFWKGEFDLSLDICHTCDVKRCVNPEHLWVGTHRQNMIDHVQKGRHYELKKTHCVRGHEFTEENTEWKSNGPGRNLARCCKICQRAKMRIQAGWPSDLAYSMGVIPKGYGYCKRTQTIMAVKSMPRY